MKLTDEMVNGLQGIWNNYVITGLKLFLGRDIPQDKLQNAINKYGSSRLEEDEEIILLFDETFFGSAEAGFFLTTKYLYLRNNDTYGGSSIIISIEQIKQIYYEKAFAGHISVEFDKNLFKLVIDGWRDTSIMANLLWEMILFLQNYSNIQEENTTIVEHEQLQVEYTPPTGPVCAQCNTPL